MHILKTSDDLDGPTKRIEFPGTHTQYIYI